MRHALRKSVARHMSPRSAAFSRPIVMPYIKVNVTAGPYHHTNMFSKLLPVISLAGYAAAQAGGTWRLPDAPADGFTDVTFTYNFANAIHESEYYYANQVSVLGGGKAGHIIYTGFQPREDKDGKSVVHAVFSTFLDNSTTTDPNCRLGADGGGGVSCAFDIVGGSYADTWSSVVTRDGDSTTWSGKAVDTVTGAEYHIGTFTLVPGTKGFEGSQSLFVEAYNLNGKRDKLNCIDNTTYTEVKFYPPTSKSATSGSVTGSVSGFVKDECKGAVNVTLTDGVLDVVAHADQKP